MSKYPLVPIGLTNFDSKKIYNLNAIANELAEANRLKRLELQERQKIIIENHYSEEDDIKLAKEMLQQLEDHA